MNGECGDNFFEGAEKLLEIWFSSSKKDDDENKNIRLIPRKSWEKILDHVQCKILDSMECGNQIAFLLSESSMFISKRRVILKTCGNTLCLQAFPFIVELADKYCGLDIVADVFYSRKNFMRPNLQPHVHTSFKNEIEFLDMHFKNEMSAAYCLGKLNADCWYLYTLNHPANKRHIGVQQPDQTLEILMTNLDVVAMQQYSFHDENGNVRSAEKLTEQSGIADLIPNSNTHSALFEPCGYSMNGLLGNEEYWTIHVTPEPEYSYVSFETNTSQCNYKDLVEKVLGLFKPGHFTMTLFVSKNSSVKMESWEKNNRNELVITGYGCSDFQTARLQEYTLYFMNYDAY